MPTPTRRTPLFTLVTLGLVAAAPTAHAQLPLSYSDPVEIYFSGFTGAGFAPDPAAGQLDSDTWSVLGTADGDLDFGLSASSGAFAAGTSPGGVTAGGVYAFQPASVPGLTLFGFQATSSDMTPGAVVLRLVNESGAWITGLQLAANVYTLNDGDRSTSLDLSWSSDGGATWSPFGAPLLTPEAAAAAPAWAATALTGVVSDGLLLAQGGTLLVRFGSDDAGGSGSRDELGLAAITLTPSICGNAQVEPGEFCDPDLGDLTPCDEDCSAVVCGDGHVNPAAGEQCDVGGEVSFCDVDCTYASCGDGTRNAAAGEACDDGDELVKLPNVHLATSVVGVMARSDEALFVVDELVNAVDRYDLATWEVTRGLFGRLTIPAFEDCAAAGDEDGDGVADCDDPDCAGTSACGGLEVCTGSVDEDGDGLINCVDPDCANTATCRFVPYELNLMAVSPVDGSVVVARNTGGKVYHFDGGTGAFLEMVANASAISGQPVTGLIFAPNGDLYVGGRDALVRYTPRAPGTAWQPLGQVVELGLSSGVRPMRWGPQGALYIGYGRILTWYDPDTGAVLGSTEFAATVRDFHFDPLGRFWIATSGVALADVDTGAILHALVGSGGYVQLLMPNDHDLWVRAGSGADPIEAHRVLGNSDERPDACRTNCGAARCGDGVTDAGESCDSGSHSPTCDPDCTAVVCGDGVVNAAAGELCDPGQETMACDIDCTWAVCGDGHLNTLAGEVCDDGAGNSDTAADACRRSCQLARCGDGALDTGEACDAGADNSDTVADACRLGCVAAWCGDGVVDAGEGCDDGAGNSATAPDACRPGCVAPSCGDGIVDSGEACDAGADNSVTVADACRLGCVAAGCGDGVVDSGEACDAGADNSDTVADACRLGCVAAWCGDGVVDAGEGCDDGASNSDTVADACRLGCVAAGCGDGVVDAGEGCDDGAGNSDTASGACRLDCNVARCGDGVVDSGEGCDAGVDNSDTAADACRLDCCVARCGDGVVDGGEGCDGGGESAGCNADCAVAACGDGVVNASAGEACDDAGVSAACDVDCTLAACGDGVVNAAAGEACEGGEGCDAGCQLVPPTVSGRDGGGCGAAPGPVGALAWALLALGIVWRRRRRARAPAAEVADM